MSCPKCNSDDWKAASLVHMSGIVSVNTNTTTVGAGLGVGSSGVGAAGGVASGNTSGQHQSVISAMTAPPEKPNDAAEKAAYWIIAFLLSSWLTKWSDFFGLVVFCLFIFIWISGKAKRKESLDSKLAEYERELAKWEQTRMCQRCGCLYVPILAPVEAVPSI